jgi:hypothetical protein
MVKKLTKHGNSLALVIDRPILDLLKIDAGDSAGHQHRWSAVDHCSCHAGFAPREI